MFLYSSSHHHSSLAAALRSTVAAAAITAHLPPDDDDTSSFTPASIEGTAIAHGDHYRLIATNTAANYVTSDEFLSDPNLFPDVRDTLSPFASSREENDGASIAETAPLATAAYAVTSNNTNSSSISPFSVNSSSSLYCSSSSPPSSSSSASLQLCDGAATALNEFADIEADYFSMSSDGATLVAGSAGVKVAEDSAHSSLATSSAAAAFKSTGNNSEVAVGPEASANVAVNHVASSNADDLKKLLNDSGVGLDHRVPSISE